MSAGCSLLLSSPALKHGCRGRLLKFIVCVVFGITAPLAEAAECEGRPSSSKVSNQKMLAAENNVAGISELVSNNELVARDQHSSSPEPLSIEEAPSPEIPFPNSDFSVPEKLVSQTVRSTRFTQRSHKVPLKIPANSPSATKLPVRKSSVASEISKRAEQELNHGSEALVLPRQGSNSVPETLASPRKECDSILDIRKKGNDAIKALVGGDVSSDFFTILERKQTMLTMDSI